MSLSDSGKEAFVETFRDRRRPSRITSMPVKDVNVEALPRDHRGRRGAGWTEPGWRGKGRGPGRVDGQATWVGSTVDWAPSRYMGCQLSCDRSKMACHAEDDERSAQQVIALSLSGAQVAMARTRPLRTNWRIVASFVTGWRETDYAMTYYQDDCINRKKIKFILRHKTINNNKMIRIRPTT